MKLFLPCFCLLMAVSSFAKANPNLITCDSINRWTSSSSGVPLASDEVWHIRIGRQPGETNYYLFSFVKTKSGVKVLGPLESLAQISYHESGSTADFMFSLISQNGMSAEGRFTAHRVSLPLSPSDPIIMYGWSVEPSTVPAAMEYRCEAR